MGEEIELGEVVVDGENEKRGEEEGEERGKKKKKEKKKIEEKSLFSKQLLFSIWALSFVTFFFTSPVYYSIHFYFFYFFFLFSFLFFYLPIFSCLCYLYYSIAKNSG